MSLTGEQEGGYIFVATDAKRMQNDEYLVESYNPREIGNAYDQLMDEMREVMNNPKILYFYLCDDIEAVLDGISRRFGVLWATINGGKEDWIREERISHLMQIITHEISQQLVDDQRVLSRGGE